MTRIRNRRELVDEAHARAAALRAEAEAWDQLAAYAELAPKQTLADPLARALVDHRFQLDPARKGEFGAALVDTSDPELITLDRKDA